MGTQISFRENDEIAKRAANLRQRGENQSDTNRRIFRLGIELLEIGETSQQTQQQDAPQSKGAANYSINMTQLQHENDLLKVKLQAADDNKNLLEETIKRLETQYAAQAIQLDSAINANLHLSEAFKGFKGLEAGNEETGAEIVATYEETSETEPTEKNSFIDKLKKFFS